ncbi:hypothetical protein ABIA00_002650 [Bradyrhizobium ottawaense]
MLSCLKGTSDSRASQDEVASEHNRDALIAHHHAPVSPVDVVAVTVRGIVIARTAIGVAGRGSGSIGACNIGGAMAVLISAVAAVVSEAVVSDRCAANRTLHRRSAPTSGADTPSRREITARCRSSTETRRRAAKAGTGGTARPYRRTSCESRRTSGCQRRRPAGRNRRRPGHGGRRRKLREGCMWRQRHGCERRSEGQYQECLAGHGLSSCQNCVSRTGSGLSTDIRSDAGASS